MKPANFPARQDARRQGALARLGVSPKTKLTAEQINVHAATLMGRLAPDARDVRSKKPRGQRRQAA